MFAGVEIGGTKTQVCLGREDGSLIKTLRGKVNAAEGSRGILAWIKVHLRQLVEEASACGDAVRAVGVGFGGPIETRAGIVLKSVQIEGWDGFHLKAWFEDTFGIPAFVFNDSSAAGYGEYILGSGRGTRQFFYTNMGSGIGGSLVLNGMLYDGQGFGAAELGQTRVPDWDSGRAGGDIKLEALCSGWATEQRLRRPGYIDRTSMLMELCGGRCEQATCQMLGEAAGAGDLFALSELDRVAVSMSIALANVLSLTEVERIAVGGGFSLIGDPLFERLRIHTKEREFISCSNRYDIVPCELGEAIVLQGAILLAAKESA